MGISRPEPALERKQSAMIQLGVNCNKKRDDLNVN